MIHESKHSGSRAYCVGCYYYILCIRAFSGPPKQDIVALQFHAPCIYGHGRKERRQIKDMKTMMKKPAYLTFLSVILALLVCSCSSKKSITLLDYGNECETEWNDGKLWAYKTTEDGMVGIAINAAKDHPGVYQMNLILKNNTSRSIVFDPAGISIVIASGTEYEKLDTYEYPLTPNKGMAEYDEGENIYLLSKMSGKGEDFEQIGYLKKNTIYGGQGIIGYLNFEVGGTGVLGINIPVGKNMYGFQWYIGKSKQLPPVYSSTNQVSIVDYDNMLKKEWEDGILWAYKNTNDYEIGAALCVSNEDGHNYQLRLKIKSKDGSHVIFDSYGITAQLAKGKSVLQLNTGNFQSYQGQGVQNAIGYIERDWRDSGIIKVDVPIGNEIHTFQWSINF